MPLQNTQLKEVATKEISKTTEIELLRKEIKYLQEQLQNAYSRIREISS